MPISETFLEKHMKKDVFSLPKVSIFLIFSLRLMHPPSEPSVLPQGVGNTAPPPGYEPLTPPQVFDPVPAYGWIFFPGTDGDILNDHRHKFKGENLEETVATNC